MSGNIERSVNTLSNLCHGGRTAKNLRLKGRHAASRNQNLFTADQRGSTRINKPGIGSRVTQESKAAQNLRKKRQFKVQRKCR
jgi:hypothetical protein